MSEHLIRVLLVEDEPVYAQLLQEILKELSYSEFALTPVHRLAAAAECLKAGPVDVILLDLSLPDCHGLDTYVEIKKLADAIPIIVLTGSDDEKLALQAVRQGAQDYVVKGQFDCRMLLRVIRYAIERKRTEETLREREAFFRLILENVHDLIAVIDRRGKRLYNSPSYRTILGNPDALVGTNSFKEIHAEDRESILRAFQETIRTGTGRRAEYRMVMDDGSSRHIESQGSVIRDERGEVSKVVVVSRDVTERKEAVEVLRQALADLKRSHEELKAVQKQLIQAEQLEAVSTFAAGVAHEVKNPLQTIILGVDYLGNHVVGDDETAATVLGEMAEAVQRADAIIRGLLEFAGYSAREIRDQNLSFIVEQSLRSVQTELANYPIVVVKDLLASPPVLRLDFKTIKHVLINLFMMAIRAMREGGTLTVRTSARQWTDTDAAARSKRCHFKPGDTIVMAEIGDTGPGVLEDKLAAAVGTPHAPPAARQGSGVGFTVAEKIIELYGGFIETASRPEATTTTILFKAHELPSNQ